MLRKEFANESAFESWYEDADNPGCYPVLIVDKDKQSASADMTIRCKKVSTAVKKFSDTFSDVSAFDGWLGEIMQEAVDNGIYQDRFSLGYGFSKEEVADCIRRKGSYSWGVEQLDENLWYIFINVSGIWAGYPEKE